MKKSIIAAALAGVVLLSGCSNVSQEEYNSVVAENSKLKEENSELKQENKEDGYLTEEYIKILISSFVYNGNTSIIDDEVKQYNIEVSQVIAIDNDDPNRGKGILYLKSSNSALEKAAFCHYFVEETLNNSLGKMVEAHEENSPLVFFVIDNENVPIYVWIAYKENGNAKFFTKYLDESVKSALDEVKSNPDKWQYVPTDTTSNN